MSARKLTAANNACLQPLQPGKRATFWNITITVA